MSVVRLKPVIAVANQDKGKYHREPITTQRKNKRGKTQATKSQVVLILKLIGRESGTSFMDQSQTQVKQARITLDPHLKIVLKPTWPPAFSRALGSSSFFLVIISP